MTKYNKSSAYVKSVPDIIRDVVVNQSHTLTSEETTYFREEEFFAENDAFMAKMGFPSLPLIVYSDQNGGKTIALHPKFDMKLNATFGHNDFTSYQYLFAKRFEEYELEKEQGGHEDDELGEFQEKKDAPPPPVQKFGDKIKEPPKEWFDAEGAAELEAARVRNADYAANVAQGMFEDNGHYLDEYGMIENRHDLFLQQMDEICDLYELPRLRVKFDDQGMPQFNADAESAEKVRALYAERKQRTNDVLKTFKDDMGSATLSLNIIKDLWVKHDNPAAEVSLQDQVINYTMIFAENGEYMVVNGGHTGALTEERLKPSAKIEYTPLNYN